MKKIIKNPFPVYSRLIENFTSIIKKGKLKIDAALPSENELAKDYNISRSSVRSALKELQETELIYSIPGKGSFVKELNPSNSVIKQDRIAFIVPGLENSDFQIYQGIEETMNKEGFILSIFNSQRSIEKENRNLRLLLERNEKGALIFPNWGRANTEIIFELKRNNYPFVLIDRYFRDLKTDYVVTDNKKGGYLATEYLIKLGHRKIGIILGLSCTAIEDRLEGYRTALAKHGIPYDLSLVRRIRENRHGEGRMSKTENLPEDKVESINKIEPSEGGYIETRKLLKEKPTAIFAANDFLARGALQAIKEEKLSIPRDISLIGFDNQKFCESLIPPLTTIAQPFYQIGKKAAEVLLKKLNGDVPNLTTKNARVDAVPAKSILPPKLIIRDSCAKIVKRSGKVYFAGGAR